MPTSISPGCLFFSILPVDHIEERRKIQDYVKPMGTRGHLAGPYGPDICRAEVLNGPLPIRRNQRYSTQAIRRRQQQIGRDWNIGDQSYAPATNPVKLDRAQMQGILIDNETSEVCVDKIRDLRRRRGEELTSGRKDKTLSVTRYRNGPPRKSLVRGPGELSRDLFVQFARSLQREQLRSQRIIGRLQMLQLRVQVREGNIGGELAGK